jgi:5-methyltetrahydrofolate--homocysteine methyltransferase
VVKSARVMKRAVARLTPLMEAEKARTKGARARRIVLATVKGDVHDIGKNIVGVVLSCNGWEVTDLGVMVSADRVLSEAREREADLIGLSGLITPSLDEMRRVASEMERTKVRVPLLIGGATTSATHTAVRIATEYSQPVVHVPDASRVVAVASHLADAGRREAFAAEVRLDQDRRRKDHALRQAAVRLLPLEEARRRAERPGFDGTTSPRPAFLGVRAFDGVPLS